MDGNKGKKMHKFIKLSSLLLITTLLFCVGCKKNDPNMPTGNTPPAEKIALITETTELELDFDYASIWEGVISCSEANGLNYGYYRPSEMTEEAITLQFEYAIQDGATSIMCMGDVFASIVGKFQAQHPNVKFIVINASEESVGPLKENTHTIMFRQEQGGYIAGYGAVKDGFTKLAFMGDHPAENFKNYANGFIQGANDAAKLMNVAVEIKIGYKTDYESAEVAINAVDAWFKEGTETIMVCADDSFLSACAEKAVNNLGYLIGTDNDKSYLGASLDYNPFITSSMKGLREAVDATLEMALAGVWDEQLGGKTLYFGLQNGNYIYMPEYEATWLFKDFTLEEYNTIKTKISQGEILIDGQKTPEVSNLVTLKINQ